MCKFVMVGRVSAQREAGGGGLESQVAGGTESNIRLPCFREDIDEGLQEGALLRRRDVPLSEPFLDVRARNLEHVKLVVRARKLEERFIDWGAESGFSWKCVEEVG